MRFRIRTAVCTLLFLCALLWVAAPIAAVEGWTGQAAFSDPDTTVEETDSISPDQAVQEAIKQLAKEQAYADWLEADYRLYPLGPGSHGWVAILAKDGEEIGYVTMGATPEGDYILTEYGSGAYPLFSLHTLYRTLVQWGLIPEAWTVDQLVSDPSIILERYYDAPLFAAWKVHTKDGVYWFDAKTGEGYPDAEDVAFSNKSLQPADGITLGGEVSTVEIRIFDPFNHLFWIQPDPTGAAVKFSDLKSHLASDRHVVYSTLIMNDMVTMPLAVTGTLERSDQEPVVIVDHYGPRHMSYQALKKAGEFYLE